MENARDRYFFYKVIYKLFMWWVIIGKWKNDVNNGPIYQHSSGLVDKIPGQ